MSSHYFFDADEKQLVNIFGTRSKITAVFYHLWVNMVQPDSKFIFIDTVELVSENQSSLFFKINNEDTGFNILTDYDFESEQLALEQQFSGSLSLKRIDVSSAPMWVDNLKTPLVKIQVERDDDQPFGEYISITFEAGAIEIDYDQETGLNVQVFEEI